MYSFIIITFFLIIGTSLHGIKADKLPYSLNKIFFIFTLFFMGVAPLVQFISGLMPFSWMHNQANQTSFLATNGLVLACLAIYLFVHKKNTFGLSTPKNEVDNFYADSHFIKRYQFWGNLIFLIAIFSQILISGHLWNRGLAEDTIVISNSSLKLLADKLLKGIVLYFSLLSLYLFKQKKIGQIQILLVLLLSLISNFPTAIPRYWLASFYGGLTIVFFHSFFIRHKHSFNILMTAALCLIFPLIGTVRLKKEEFKFDFSSLLNGFNSIYQVLKKCFCGQDFDAYGSLRNTILYVQSHGLLWGKQLSTTLLFFIPRSIWPNKSIGSGALVTPPRPGSDFHNYSSPLIAEGYIDFGFVGSLALIALFAFICSKYDNYIWHKQSNSFARIFYPAYLSMAFFMLRGDLLSSFAYTVGIVASGMIFHKILWKSVYGRR